MTRVRDHLNHLNRVLTDNQDRLLVYGEWDCCILAADVALAVSGVDHMADFRGQYTSLREAVALIRKLGHSSLLEATTARLGEPISPLSAWRGDIVHHNSNLGVCVGATATFITDYGQGRVPMSEIKTVFGVR
jgi:Zn-dependent alcohol dehydrogenase